MARTAKSFERRGARFKPVATVLVLCEDAKSSKLYFQSATIHFRVNVKVDVAHCGKTDPKGIVQEAIDRSSKFDTVFCVIDRDTHPSFDEACSIANKHQEKIKLIVSYPCFEFWYLLHFGHTTKPYAAVGKQSAGDRLASDLRQCAGMSHYDKSSEELFNDLLPKLPDARRFSPRILEEAVAARQMNPSTQVHQLIDYLEQLEKPQPI